MKRPIENRRLTRNFHLYEFMEAHPTRDIVFIEQNWANWMEFENNYTYERNAEFAQKLRDVINERFISENGGKEIGLRLTSAFRNTTWEKARGRKGEHPRTAMDVQPTNVTPQMAVRVLTWLHGYLVDHDGGLAIKKPTYFNGKLQAVGFVHVDFGRKRRWPY